MKSRNIFRASRFSSLALAAALVLFVGCSRQDSTQNDASPKPAAAKLAAEAVDPGQGDNIEQVKTALANCEHQIPMYQCEECRYEAGVVKIDASLWKNKKGGLLSALTVMTRKMQAAKILTGEVSLNVNAAVHLNARAAGVIESVAVDIGATVKAGSELFAISSTEFGRALSDYERSRALTLLSEKNFKREEMLVAKKVSPEQDLIEAQMTYEQHRAELNAAEQTLHVMGLTDGEMARLKDGKHDPTINRLATRSPLNGTVVERHAAIGELVEPGKEVMLVADLTTVWVWANVHERDLAALIKARKLGPIPVSIIVPSFPGKAFTGKIDYIGVTVDEQTRTVKVRATVGNPDLALRPGMFCEVRAGIGAEEDALTVPRIAVLADEGQEFVFVHWKDDFYMRRPVVTGRMVGNLIELVKGLRAGEMIITDGSFLLKSDVLRKKMGAGCAD
jgi:cobalt-zinc-cadmium efflux system membrane fusion protein